MPHSSGTKYYHLITITDKNTGGAVGIQLWGANGTHTPQHKYVTGSDTSVRSAQLAKQNEKERTRNGGRYEKEGPSRKAEPSSISQLNSYVRGLMETHGASAVASTSITSGAIDNLGESFVAVGEEQREEDRKAELARLEAIQQERNEVYAGAWGAW